MMQLFPFSIILMAFALSSCVSSPPLRRPSVIAEQQGTAIDGIVNGWYANAAENPDCRRVLELPDDVRKEAVPVDRFTSRRAPIFLVLSSAVELRHGESCVWEEHGCMAWNDVTVFAFTSARILYARNNEDLIDLPAEFELWEAGALGRSYPNIARDFIRADRAYAIFAYTNDVMRDQRIFVLAVCDLSNPTTLSTILGQPEP